MAILYALIAALAFGLSAPLAKRLLDVVPPLFLAGLLYLGAGVFLGGVRRLWRPRAPAAPALASRASPPGPSTSCWRSRAASPRLRRGRSPSACPSAP